MQVLGVVLINGLQCFLINFFCTNWLYHWKAHQVSWFCAKISFYWMDYLYIHISSL